jgi:hypothetical protein
VADAGDSAKSTLHSTSPAGPLYRIARAPDPWSWPDWANVGSDGTFGNRWDDSEGVYRVLYASSSRLGAFVEVLARFRPDLHVVEALAQIEDPTSRARSPGELDASWLANRRIGVALVRGDFVDVGHSRSLARIRAALAPRVVHYGLDDLDAAAIRVSAPRGFTQEISRWVYDQSTAAGRRRFAGISYLSRLGDEFRNWAIFEPAGIRLPVTGKPEARPIDRDDSDLRRALELLGVRLVGTRRRRPSVGRRARRAQRRRR